MQWCDLGSASCVPGITGTRHPTGLIFIFLVKTGFHHVVQAGVKLLTSSGPPALVSQSVWIIGMSLNFTASSLNFQVHRQKSFLATCNQGTHRAAHTQETCSLSKRTHRRECTWIVALLTTTALPCL